MTDTPEIGRHKRAILLAERRGQEETNGRCLTRAEELVAGLERALEAWNASADDRADGIVHPNRIVVPEPIG